ncbi:MAG: PaaI family thioesterase [Burkholderiaceae bacterium]
MDTSSPRYGVATREQIATLTGLQTMQAILDGVLPQAPISKTLGFVLVEVGPGVAVFEGTPTAELLNPMGGVHGGWALTLIDSATGCAGFTVLPAGVGYTTIETKGNMTRAITPQTGPVRAEGRVLTQGRQVIVCDARLTDSAGKVLALGTSTLMVLGPR